MNWSYSCPHCRSGLNPDETITLVGEQGDLRTLVGLHPEPGNYRAYLPAAVQVERGTRWRFFCPLCQHDLVSEESEELCALDLVIAGDRRRVLFSCTAGEQATFCIRDGEVIESHGGDVERHSLELLELM